MTLRGRRRCHPHGLRRAAAAPLSGSHEGTGRIWQVRPNPTSTKLSPPHLEVWNPRARGHLTRTGPRPLGAFPLSFPAPPLARIRPGRSWLDLERIRIGAIHQSYDIHTVTTSDTLAVYRGEHGTLFPRRRERKVPVSTKAPLIKESASRERAHAIEPLAG